MRLPEEQKKDALQPQDRAAQDLPAALRGWLDDATGQMRAIPESRPYPASSHPE